MKVQPKLCSTNYYYSILMEQIEHEFNRQSNSKLYAKKFYELWEIHLYFTDDKRKGKVNLE